MEADQSKQYIPRVSPANITPSLNLIPNIEVPVTIGSLEKQIVDAMQRGLDMKK